MWEFTYKFINFFYWGQETNESKEEWKIYFYKNECVGKRC